MPGSALSWVFGAATFSRFFVGSTLSWPVAGFTSSWPAVLSPDDDDDDDDDDKHDDDDAHDHGDDGHVCARVNVIMRLRYCFCVASQCYHHFQYQQ
jgi:hypothetical protein